MHRIGGGVVLALVLATASARAQGPAAEALYQQGLAAMKSSDLDTACARFRASDRLDPAVGTELDLGDCEGEARPPRQRMGGPTRRARAVPRGRPEGEGAREAHHETGGALAEARPHARPRRAYGERRSVRGDIVLGTDATYGVPLPLDPGVHHLTVVASGRPTREFDVKLAEGKTATVKVAPGSTEALPEPPPDAGLPAPSPPAEPAGQRLLVHVRSSVGAVTLMAIVPDGDRPLCRVPCDRFIESGAGHRYLIAGDGVTASEPFELRKAETTINVRAGSIARRRAGIALTTVGTVLTFTGVLLTTLGFLGADDSSTYVYDRHTGETYSVLSSSHPVLLTGLVLANVAPALIAGGVVLLRQGKTSVRLDAAGGRPTMRF